MAYAIRRFALDDAQALADITLQAIQAIGSSGYSPQQVAAWSARHPGPARFVLRAEQGHIILVAADDQDEPVAYTLLEPDGHLDMLYAHPQHTRQGLADRLLLEAEIVAQSLDVARLYTEASELARPAFQRAGYSVTHRRDFVIEHNGQDVPIHNFAMEKLLV